MCQQDVLQRKIIICAKLHVFLSMCHTMQWSNGLTFFMTEDLHSRACLRIGFRLGRLRRMSGRGPRMGG